MLHSAGGRSRRPNFQADGGWPRNGWSERRSSDFHANGAPTGRWTPLGVVLGSTGSTATMMRHRLKESEKPWCKWTHPLASCRIPPKERAAHLRNTVVPCFLWDSEVWETFSRLHDMAPSRRAHHMAQSAQVGWLTRMFPATRGKGESAGWTTAAVGGPWRSSAAPAVSSLPCGTACVRSWWGRVVRCSGIVEGTLVVVRALAQDGPLDNPHPRKAWTRPADAAILAWAGDGAHENALDRSGWAAGRPDLAAWCGDTCRALAGGTPSCRTARARVRASPTHGARGRPHKSPASAIGRSTQAGKMSPMFAKRPSWSLPSRSRREVPAW